MQYIPRIIHMHTVCPVLCYDSQVSNAVGFTHIMQGYLLVSGQSSFNCPNVEEATLNGMDLYTV